MNVVLSPSQRSAIELALRSKVMVLTGGPGTGKTTLTRAILENHEASEGYAHALRPYWARGKAAIGFHRDRRRDHPPAAAV